jgi:hypothetical protein
MEIQFAMQHLVPDHGDVEDARLLCGGVALKDLGREIDPRCDVTSVDRVTQFNLNLFRMFGGIT